MLLQSKLAYQISMKIQKSFSNAFSSTKVCYHNWKLFLGVIQFQGFLIAYWSAKLHIFSKQSEFATLLPAKVAFACVAPSYFILPSEFLKASTNPLHKVRLNGLST
jgi:hypothetical protein